MTDDAGSSWAESGTSSVNSDGTVNLWEGTGANFTASMNASKDVIAINYQDTDEYCFDVMVKQGSNYTTADLQGRWHMRGLCTQKNGAADNFGFDFGTLYF